MANVPKGLLRGGKFNQNHSTVIDVSIPLIKKLNKLDYVTKIILGPIRQLKSGQIRIVVQGDIQAGIKVFVRGSGCGQQFFVYTEEKEKLKDFIATEL
jgi:hypothetical protein